MRLTVIGSNGAVPRPGGACSGYLVEDGGTRLLLDCGSGAYSRLQLHLDPFDLDAVIISHLHADHFFDLVPFRYALFYALRGRRPTPLPLYLPPGGKAMLAGFARSFGSPADFFAAVFALHEYEPSKALSVGGLALEFTAMPHFIPSFGVRVRGSATIVYSADTAMGEAVVSHAREADLFLCEATAQASTYEQTKAGHMSASDAARCARLAGAKSLLLTHIWHELDPAVSLAEARQEYEGRIEVASEGTVYDLDKDEVP